MILFKECCILYSDEGKRRKAVAAVAQMVEREKIGLGKGLNSKTNSKALSQVRILSQKQLFKCFPKSKAALLWKISLEKGFHSNSKVVFSWFESGPGKAAKKSGGMKHEFYGKVTYCFG